MSASYAWLPVEIIRPQPYSMGPLMRWVSPQRVPQGPATSIVALDRAPNGQPGGKPERDILTCLIAPRSVQSQARRAGVNAVIMIRPKGIEIVNSKLTSTAESIERAERQRAKEGAEA